MKEMYCWRCDMVIPMLDDEEYMRVHKREGEIWKNRENYSKNGLAVFKRSIGEAVLEEYNKITGFNETNYLAIYHHRISIYGEPCGNCGKPLRTPLARFCAACGWKPAQ